MTPTGSRAIRVLLIEDHVLLAHSLGLALRAEGMQVAVAALTSCADIVAGAQTDPPDLVLLDLELGGEIGDGSALVRPLTDTGARVLVVTGVTDRCRLAATVEQGAVGLVSKSEPFDVLLDTVLRLARGEQVFGQDSCQQLLIELRRHRTVERARRQPFEQLTPREQQVLSALADGKTVDVISSEWVVSTATVRTQVRAVLTKIGVNSQLAAVALARRSGWLTHRDDARTAYVD